MAKTLAGQVVVVSGSFKGYNHGKLNSIPMASEIASPPRSSLCSDQPIDTSHTDGIKYLVEKLGGIFSATVTDACTHLITTKAAHPAGTKSKQDLSLSRTLLNPVKKKREKHAGSPRPINCSAIHALGQYNLRFPDQQAIALGNDIKIVSLDWLTESQDKKQHLDEAPYSLALPAPGKPSVDGTGPRRSGRTTQSQSQSQSQTLSQPQSQPANGNGKVKKAVKNKKDDEDEDDSADQPPAKKQKTDPTDAKPKTKAKATKDTKDTKATKATKTAHAAVLNVPVDDLVPQGRELYSRRSDNKQWLTLFPF